MNSRAFVGTFTAGDTLDMSIANGNAITVPNYPASDGWTLTYRLTPQFSTPVQVPIDLDCATDSDGESYLLQRNPAVTAGWAPGSYSWARWVHKSGARVMLERDQQLDILPDPAASAQGDDRRSTARQILEAIESALKSRALTAAQRDMVAYAIGTRSQQFDAADTRTELIKAHSHYTWLVANEDAREAVAAGLPNPRLVGVRFG